MNTRTEPAAKDDPRNGQTALEVPAQHAAINTPADVPVRATPKLPASKSPRSAESIASPLHVPPRVNDVEGDSSSDSVGQLRDAGLKPAATIPVQPQPAAQELRSTRQTLEDRTAQLVDANENLEAFSYSISHDLRAPLRHIVGFLELLRRDAGPLLSAVSLRHMATISGAALRVGHLIEDLLGFSRIARAEMHQTMIDLNELAKDICGASVQGLKERHIVWEIHSLPTVRGDRNMVRLMLAHLVSNAVKFTSERREARIEIGCAPSTDDEVVIFIRDNGAGFDPRYVHQLFGVFRRLHREDEFEGRGIGLANVKRIMLRHGGRVWADGIVDGGATFFVAFVRQPDADAGIAKAMQMSPKQGYHRESHILPVALSPDSTSAPIAASASLQEESQTAIKLLVVEDSEEDAELMLDALRSGGFDVKHHRVQTAEELESSLERESWDAVVSDFQLPTLTGFDVLAIVRCLNVDIPFILLSGTIGEDIAVAAMKAGASDYIMKSSLARLAPALKRELKETGTRAAHRKSQHDLIASEDRFRGLTALSSDWYWEQDENLRFTFVSAGLPNKYSEALESWGGKTRWELPYRNADWTEHRRIIEAHQPFHNVELQPFMQDGSTVYISVSGEPKFDAKGKFHGYRGVGTDITERVTRVDDLRRFHTAMDAISDAIFLVDRDSMRFVHVNDAACRLHGLPRDEVLALDPFGVLLGSRDALETVYDSLIESGAVPEPEESIWRRAHGSTIWIDVRRHAHLVRGRWTIVIVVRDITERKAAADRLKRSNRGYAMLSGVNALVVRVRDRAQLFNAAAQIALEHGELVKVWIGLIDGARGHIVPVSTAGFDERALSTLGEFLSSNAIGSSDNALVSSAIRQRCAAVSADLRNDGGLMFGELPDTPDTRSAAVFPIIVSDDVIGVISFLTSTPEFLDTAGLKLLAEITDIIASAVDHIDKRERLNYLAYYDALTGLANRGLFLDRLAQYMRSATSGRHKLAVVLVDLERFKSINDTLGRPAGDSLLKQVASWLEQSAGDNNLMARIGANTFAVILPIVTNEGEVGRLVEATLRHFVVHSFTLNDVAYRIAAKIGIVLFPDDGAEVDVLLQHAEAALKKAKATGDRYLFYAQKMTETVAGTLGLENQLRQALENREFVLHYQPKVSIVTGLLTGAEALIRWNSPQLGLVPPGRFIPILEQTGLIHDVGRWALSEAVREYLRWRDAGLPAVRIAVNVSPLQLRNRAFVGEVANAVSVDARAPAGLELEITESLLMEDVNHSIVSLQAIRAMGLRVAIDDFGTGFSSLNYLAKLPVDALKIDRSFVVDMVNGAGGKTLVSVIINLAHELNLNVIAEGVETDEQLLELRRMHCDEMQGYLFGKAVAGESFQKMYLTSTNVA